MLNINDMVMVNVDDFLDKVQSEPHSPYPYRYSVMLWSINGSSACCDSDWMYSQCHPPRGRQCWDVGEGYW